MFQNLEDKERKHTVYKEQLGRERRYLKRRLEQLTSYKRRSVSECSSSTVSSSHSTASHSPSPISETGNNRSNYNRMFFQFRRYFSVRIVSGYPVFCCRTRFRAHRTKGRGRPVIICLVECQKRARRSEPCSELVWVLSGRAGGRKSPFGGFHTWEFRFGRNKFPAEIIPSFRDSFTSFICQKQLRNWNGFSVHGRVGRRGTKRDPP